MTQNTEWINFQLKTEWLIKSKAETDGNGNIKIPLKIMNLATPFAIIKISSKCVYPDKFDKHYIKVGIAKNYEYMYWDREGILFSKKITGYELARYLEKMQKIVERQKARSKRIYLQNKATMKKFDKANNVIKEE
ncbi:hypothetical protein [Spiroplasma sp. DGKH1]|uniref:hypothetical protein n=1 Tax=Spiroplasma sp. DGKH1 TaxID=3050074 RepID=UPI0034C6A313